MSNSNNIFKSLKNIAIIYSRNDVGGPLRIVLDDGNIDDTSIQYCLDTCHEHWAAIADPDIIPFVESVAKQLLSVDEDERKRFYDSDRVLSLPFVKPARRVDLLDGFLCVFRQDAVGIHPGHILPTLYVPGVLQGRNGGCHPRFDFRDAVVPACSPGDFQGGLGYFRTELCQVFYRLPYLLDFLDAYFCLIEKNEMPAQIVVVK